MPKNQSPSNSMFPRAAAARVIAALKDTPVVMVNGPRQCGKSTLVRAIADTKRATLNSLRSPWFPDHACSVSGMTNPPPSFRPSRAAARAGIQGSMPHTQLAALALVSGSRLQRVRNDVGFRCAHLTGMTKIQSPAWSLQRLKTTSATKTVVLKVYHRFSVSRRKPPKTGPSGWLNFASIEKASAA